MIYGSTFSGIGGLDLGFHRAGWQAAFFCESDAYRRRVLRRHWPGTRVFEDVRDVGSESVYVELDGLIGGVPCQDWSVAGKRAGLAGARSGLFFEFARAADELVRPGGWLVFENVPGLLTACSCPRCGERKRVSDQHRGTDFLVVRSVLANIGFRDQSWRVLDSRYFGVPQRRRRLFIVARRAAGDCSQSVLLESDSVRWDFAEGGPSWARVVSAGGAQGRAAQNGRVAAPLTAGGHGTGVSPPGRRQEDDENLVEDGDVLTQSLTTRFGTASGPDLPDAEANWLVSDDMVSAPVTAKWAKGNGGPAGDEAQNLTVTPFVKRHGANTAEDHEIWEDATEDVARTLNTLTQAGTNGAVVVEDEQQAFNFQPVHGQGADLEAHEAEVATGIDVAGLTKKGDRGTRIVDGPMSQRVYDGEADEAPTLMPNKASGGSDGPRMATGGIVRRLTPTECERLQALPDGWSYDRGPSLAHVEFVPYGASGEPRAVPVDHPPDGPRYSGCGDAVTATVAEFIADRIMRVRVRER